MYIVLLLIPNSNPEPLHINVLTWEAVEESVEGNPMALPLAGGKVKKGKGGKNRVVAIQFSRFLRCHLKRRRMLWTPKSV